MTRDYNVDTFRYCYIQDYNYSYLLITILAIPNCLAFIQFLYVWVTYNTLVWTLYIFSYVLYIITLDFQWKYSMISQGDCDNVFLSRYLFPSIEITYINYTIIYMLLYHIHYNITCIKNIKNCYGIGYFKLLCFFSLSIIYSIAYYVSSTTSLGNILMSWLFSIVLSIVTFYLSCIISQFIAHTRNQNDTTIFTFKRAITLDLPIENK
jgi:hypothetical protein